MEAGPFSCDAVQFRGIEVCRGLRGFPDACIIMLTAGVNEPDKIEGLETCAGDYISKPFSPRELRARTSALFHRPRSSPAAPATSPWAG